MKSETIITIPPQIQKNKKQKREQYFILGTIAFIVIAWLIGFFLQDTDVLEYAYQVLPNAQKVEAQNGLFVGYADTQEEPVGFAAVGEADGYGGPLQVMVGVNTEGKILGIQIVDNKETPGFFRLVENYNFLDQFGILDVTNPLAFGEDIDGISGATISTQAITDAAREAVRKAAEDGLFLSLPPEKKPIQFGMPEIVLIALFASAYIIQRLNNRQLKKKLRWGTLLAGMIFLGFVYTAPFTISQVISLLSGYWPDWQNNLYWYLLIGGILFVVTVDNKNPYCYWFCPFGAFQEVLSSVTGAKTCRPKNWQSFLTWMPRVLALTAVIMGLILRQPGVVGYEPFATLFDLRGTTFEWILLVLVILASLIVYRPFCHFICPIDPVVDFIGAIRRWFKRVRFAWKRTESED